MDFSGCPDVRIATPEDEDALISLMRIACEEDAQHPINEDKVRSVVRLNFDKRGGLIGVVGNKHDELKGYVLLCVVPVWYSDDWQLQEFSLFVSPDHRKSNYAKQLMTFAKRASDGLNLDLVIGVLSTERTEAKCRLYARQFKTIGAFFTHKPACSEEPYNGQ